MFLAIIELIGWRFRFSPKPQPLPQPQPRWLAARGEGKSFEAINRRPTELGSKIDDQLSHDLYLS